MKFAPHDRAQTNGPRGCKYGDHRCTVRDSSLEKGAEQQVNIVASASGSEDRMAISVGADGDEVAGGGGRKEGVLDVLAPTKQTSHTSHTRRHTHHRGPPQDSTC